MEFKIDKNIPRPAGWEKYPFSEMEVGDSFFLAGRKGQSLGGAAIKHRPKRFSVRTVTENGVKGIRVWRIE